MGPTMMPVLGKDGFLDWLPKVYLSIGEVRSFFVSNGAHRERSLSFDFKGREISPKVPVGAGLFIHDHCS